RGRRRPRSERDGSSDVSSADLVMQPGGGSMSTIHADNARTVIDRLVDFVGQYTGSYEYASRLVSRLFHLVVFIGTDIDANGRKRSAERRGGKRSGCRRAATCVA